MKRTRRRIDSALKAKIALDALRGQTSITELAQRHGVHPNKIYAWKKQLENYAIYLFDGHTRDIAKLEAKISSLSNAIKENMN